MMAYYHYMTDIIILLCTGIICISIPYIITTYSSLLYYQESIDMIRFSSSLSVFQVALRMTCTISMLRRRLRLPVSRCLCGSRGPRDNCGTVLGIMMVEGSLEVKLPTIWTDEKQRGRGREKRKIRREKIRRERVRRQKTQMREKGGQSRNTVFFE